MSDFDLTIKRQLEAICDEFENRWAADKRSDFLSFLDRTKRVHRDHLLRMLLDVDVELRSKAGQEVSADDYSELGDQAVAHVRKKKLLAVDPDVTVPPPSSMEPSSTKTAPETPSPSVATNQIGPYKLLQQIGEGGMGTVWMADQEKPVRRRVALKVIKGGMDSKQVIARFEAERQALAMMDHQNIAKVLDAGMAPDGRPYFAMELVQGIPITQYCDRNKLTPNERLELFVPVCQAIQHAHQKGIVHRDIKPSNVLVTLYDGKPVPKVIDFGLAKAIQHEMKLTDKTMFTQFGHVVGTLEYMSPEQAELNAMDVDTRTDVYSLGVLLYELLTGSTPIGRDRLKKEALDKILQLIREEDPPRPSVRLSDSGEAMALISRQRKTDPKRLSLILRGELDWIAIKALEKDRTRRYPTAAAFADDVQRFLRDDPIEARPPNASYRLQKAYRKHRSVFIGAASMILLLIAGIIGTTSMFLRAVESEKLSAIEAKRANNEATAAESARSKALVAEKKAQEAVRRLATQLRNYHSAKIATAISLGDFAGARNEFVDSFKTDRVSDTNSSVKLSHRILFPGLKTTFHGTEFETGLANRFDDFDVVKSYAELFQSSSVIDPNDIRWWSPSHNLVVLPDGDGIIVARSLKSTTELKQHLFDIHGIQWPKGLDEAVESSESLSSAMDDLLPSNSPKENDANRGNSEQSAEVDNGKPKTQELLEPKFVTFSPDGLQLAMVSQIRRETTTEKKRYLLRTFDLSTESLVWSKEISGIDAIMHLGEYIATCDQLYRKSMGEKLVLYDSSSGQISHVISSSPFVSDKYFSGTRTLTLSKDGTRLFGGMNSGQLWLCDLPVGNSVASRTAIAQPFVLSNGSSDRSPLSEALVSENYLISISNSERYCVIAHGGYFSFFDLKLMSHVTTVYGSYLPVLSLTISRDEQNILVIDTHGTTEWSIERLKEQSIYYVEPAYEEHIWTRPLSMANAEALQERIDAGVASRRELEAHMDGSEHLVINSKAHGLLLFATNFWSELRIRKGNAKKRIGTITFAAPPIALALTSNGQELISLDLTGTLLCQGLNGVRRWELSFGGYNQAKNPLHVQYLPDENILVVSDSEGSLHGVGVSSGTILWTQKSDKKILISTDREHAILFEFRRPTDVGPEEMYRRIELIRFSDGHKWNLLDTHVSIRQSQVAVDGKASFEFEKWWASSIASASISHDGKHLAISYSDGWGACWKLGDINPKLEFAGVSTSPCAVCFSPNDEMIVYGHGQELHFFDATTGESAGRVKYHGSRLDSIFRDSMKYSGNEVLPSIGFRSDGSLAVQYQVKFPQEGLIERLSTNDNSDDDCILRMRSPRLAFVFGGTFQGKTIGTQRQIEDSIFSRFSN